MKKFKYRLEKVLQLRERLKEEALRELTLRNGELQAKQYERERLIESFLQNRVEEGSVMSIGELSLKGQYAARLKSEIASAAVAIEEAEKAVQEATVQYVAASKEAKILTTHKEKKVEEYKEAYFKEEGRFLDELATQRAARKALQ